LLVYFIFDQINAALVSLRDLFKKTFVLNLTDPSSGVSIFAFFFYKKVAQEEYIVT